jgi:hypothetical protein
MFPKWHERIEKSFFRSFSENKPSGFCEEGEEKGEITLK